MSAYTRIKRDTDIKRESCNIETDVRHQWPTLDNFACWVLPPLNIKSTRQHCLVTVCNGANVIVLSTWAAMPKSEIRCRYPMTKDVTVRGAVLSTSADTSASEGCSLQYTVHQLTVRGAAYNVSADSEECSLQCQLTFEKWRPSQNWTCKVCHV